MAMATGRIRNLIRSMPAVTDSLAVHFGRKPIHPSAASYQSAHSMNGRASRPTTSILKTKRPPWQAWHFGEESVNSFTVITLPPHPRFSHIHPKSIPLMLRPEEFDLWLDPDFHQVDAFQGMMKTHISAPLVCEPVMGPQKLVPVGEVETIPADE